MTNDQQFTTMQLMLQTSCVAGDFSLYRRVSKIYYVLFTTTQERNHINAGEGRVPTSSDLSQRICENLTGRTPTTSLEETVQDCFGFPQNQRLSTVDAADFIKYSLIFMLPEIYLLVYLCLTCRKFPQLHG